MNKPRPSQRVRLQRFLSDAGVVSRKHAEEYVQAGRVLVNGEVIRQLPAFVDPQRDTVVVDGAVVRPAPLLYYVINKPKGVVSGSREKVGGRRAVDLVPPFRQKLLPVGQLDKDDSGLLLMTNDGRLIQRIAQPRFGVPRTYWAEVKGRAPDDLAARLVQGVHLAEGKARAVKVEIAFVSNDRSTLSITLREGRKRQVRRMLARLGLPVRNLKCTDVGPLKLKGLPLGASRPLTSREMTALHAELKRALEGAQLRRVASPSRSRRPRSAARSAPGPARPPSPKPDGDHPPRRRIVT